MSDDNRPKCRRCNLPLSEKERESGNTCIAGPCWVNSPDSKKCECGADKVGVGRHSHWCAKLDKDLK